MQLWHLIPKQQSNIKTVPADCQENLPPSLLLTEVIFPVFVYEGTESFTSSLNATPSPPSAVWVFLNHKSHLNSIKEHLR